MCWVEDFNHMNPNQIINEFSIRQPKKKTVIDSDEEDDEEFAEMEVLMDRVERDIKTKVKGGHILSMEVFKEVKTVNKFLVL
jgi:hypothetical protein